MDRILLGSPEHDGLMRLFDTFFNGMPAARRDDLETLAEKAGRMPRRDHDHPTVTVALVQKGRTLVRCNSKAYRIEVTEVEIT